MIEQLPTDSEFFSGIRDLFSWRSMKRRIQRFRARSRPFVLELVLVVVLLVIGFFAGRTTFLYTMFPAFCVCLAFTFFGRSNRTRRIVMSLVNGVLFVVLWFILVKTLVVFMSFSFDGYVELLESRALFTVRSDRNSP